MLVSGRKPVYFASKALTDAQWGYVAVKLELLAAAWPMDKFHHFLMQAILFWKWIRSP